MGLPNAGTIIALDSIVMTIPLSRPPADDEIKQAVLAAIDSRQYILGPRSSGSRRVLLAEPRRQANLQAVQAPALD